MELEQVAACPICRNQHFKNALTCKDYTTTGETFQIISCTNCGLGITSPRPPSSAISQYYASEKYISHTGGNKSAFDTVYRAARIFTNHRKAQLLRTFAREKTVLDFGCGTAAFLQHLKERKWTVDGVEPSSNANRTATAVLNQPIFKTIDEVHKTYHAITLWHVLEHIHDPEKILTKLNDRLHPQGHLFIAVPNPASFDAQHYKSFWAAYDVPRHLWHFTPANMASLLQQQGCKLTKIVPMKLDAFYVSILSERYQNPNASAFSQNVKGVVNGLKSNWLARKNRNFSSLIYIASK